MRSSDERMQHSPTRVQVALVLLLGLLWGLNWPTVKIALAEIGPWTLRASALCIAALSLVAFTWARGRALSIRRAHWCAYRGASRAYNRGTQCLDRACAALRSDGTDRGRCLDNAGLGHDFRPLRAR
jgi:hypothetical protein